MNWPRLYSCTHEHLIYVFQVVRVYTENFILIVAVRRPLFSVNDCHLYLSSFDLTQRPTTAHCARKTNSVNNRRLINQKRIRFYIQRDLCSSLPPGDPLPVNQKGSQSPEHPRFLPLFSSSIFHSQLKLQNPNFTIFFFSIFILN